MRNRLILITAFGGLSLLGLYRELQASTPPSPTRIASVRSGTPPAQPGTLPTSWNSGLFCGQESGFQVHQYNDNLYIIRQSMCDTPEAPFLYLIFGPGKALLMDTGATNAPGVYDVVHRSVRHWASVHGVPVPPTIIAHTHSHGDHIVADSQFVGQPWVDSIVALGTGDVQQFWGFQNWPHDTPTFDLGGRILDVLATPGHQAASITLYDRETHLLLTGDLVYPGHLFVFSQNDWGPFKQSLRRLVDFAATHPVEWVLGCHIEMGATPFTSFAWGTPSHLNEHSLEFPPSKLLDIYQAASSFGNSPQCTIYDEFVIHPVYTCGFTWNG